jgi:hypothetical protein
MTLRPKLRTSVALVPLTLMGLMLLGLSAGCGGGIGGSPSSKHVQEPVVRQFSPVMSPIDFNTLIQHPTFTDSSVNVSIDTRFCTPTIFNGSSWVCNTAVPYHSIFKGKLVIFFQAGTFIDPATVFIGGNPFLGPDPSALQVTREVPGVGNVQVPVQVQVVDAVDSDGDGLLPPPLGNWQTGNPNQADPNACDLDEQVTLNAIVCTPLPPFSTALPGGGYDTNMPDGQYTLGLFSNIKNSQGVGLRDSPVFQSFTVGASDTIPPRVITTDPVDGQLHVGAGSSPPAPPPGVSDNGIADVTTSIFGDTSPDITVRFTEGIAAASVNSNNVTVIDAGAFVPGGGQPPALPPAQGFPKLKSAQDQDTLPSNGHELIWRVDPNSNGFPYGTQIQVTVNGLYHDANSEANNPDNDGDGVPDPDNPAPIKDLAGNYMELDYVFQFQTIELPDLPQNPFPENAIWWSAAERVGAIDTINQQGLADQYTGAQTFPYGVPPNLVPDFTDNIANSQHIDNFDPLEINFDGRTNTTTCHTWIYVQSANTGQVAILNSRDGVPVALINSPTPGGIAVQVGSGSDNVLLVTNSGANTFTGFDVGSLTPGTKYLNGPLYIKKVQPTGNTPRAISISTWASGVAGFNRDGSLAGPSPPVIMYADFTDGTVNTITLADDEPVRQFALGPSSAPNDICFTPCFGPPAIPPIMFAAISEGGEPKNGKVAYYVAGPNCETGTQTNTRPDSIVGDLGSFDGPDGMDDAFVDNNPVFFVVAESGSDANAVSTLGVETGTLNLPRLLNRFTNVGANPTKVAHRASWPNPCIAPAGSGLCFHPTDKTCWYNGTEQDILLTQLPDYSFSKCNDLYVCARGDSQVTVVDVNTGAKAFYGTIPIPGVRFVAGPATQ